MNASLAPTHDRARSWRVGGWPHDPSVAQLVFTDHGAVPTEADLDQAIAVAVGRGARCLRTSALFPRPAEPVLAAGFVTIDELALLRLDLAQPVDPALTRPVGSEHRTRPLRLWHRRQAARIDVAAFGRLWGNSTSSLGDIATATPHHRARVVHHSGRLAGFAISGVAVNSGYLQRLAVHPDHRRVGIARALVADGLDWMRDRGADAALVNTGIGNAPALALYTALGFEQLDERLVVAELALQ